MTGMPASLAFWSAGRIALLSWARRIRTLAPLRDQGVDVGQLLLVAEVGVGVDVRAAAGLDGLLDVRLVVRRPARLLEVVPRHADGAAGGRAGRGAGRGCRCCSSGCGCGRAPPAAHAGTDPRSARRHSTNVHSFTPPRSLAPSIERATPVGYRTRLQSRLHPSYSGRRNRRYRVIDARLRRSPARRGPVGAARPPDRRAAARRRARPRRAAGRRLAEPCRHDPDERARRRQRAAVELRLEDRAATNGWIRPNRPPRTTSSGLRTLTRPGQADAEPAADVVERGQRGGIAGGGLAQDRVDAPRPPSAGRPARRRSAPSPTSVSQQPIEPQRQALPSGLTGRWPISPA